MNYGLERKWRQNLPPPIPNKFFVGLRNWKFISWRLVWNGNRRGIETHPDKVELWIYFSKSW
jgi:hypothetical protein